MQAGLVALLKGTPAVTALVGQNIFPVIVQEGVCPSITFQIIGGASWPTLQSSGFGRVRFQIDCRATTYLAADATRNAVIAALNGYQGRLPDGTPVSNIDQIQSMDPYDYEPRQYRCSVEFYAYL